MNDLVARALSTVSASLVIPHDVTGTLTSLLEEVRQAFDAISCSLVVADRHDRLEVLTSSSHRDELLELHDALAVQGPAVESWHTARAAALTDVAHAQSEWPLLAAAMDAAGACSVQVVPLRWDGHPLGALAMTRDVTGALDASQVQHLQAFADLAMLVVVHADPVSVRLAVQRVDEALTGRIVVEQAKGALAHLHETTMPEAYDLLRRRAESADVTLTDAAREVLRDAERRARPE